MEPTPITFISFCKEVNSNQIVWAIYKDGNVAAVKDPDGYDVMPFWSTKKRASKFLEKVDEYDGFRPIEIPWYLFKARWIADLIKKSMKAGINWTGGEIECEVEPEEIVQNIEPKPRK